MIGPLPRFSQLIHESMDGKLFTQLNFFVHNLAQLKFGGDSRCFTVILPVFHGPFSYWSLFMGYWAFPIPTWCVRLFLRSGFAPNHHVFCFQLSCLLLTTVG